MNKATIDRLVDTGFIPYEDEDVFVKRYVDPVIGEYGAYGLNAQVDKNTGAVTIVLFAPSGRIVDYIENQSGVQIVTTSDDVVRLNRWIESIKNEVR